MKKFYRSFLFVLFISSAMFCKAQLVQMPVDAKLLESNEKTFIEKPLETLLREIKPQIKRVLISPGGGETNSFSVFYFVDGNEYHKLRNEGKSPISIRVYTKQIINWDISDKPGKDWQKWSQGDALKYRNLTVMAIRVFGKD